MPNRKKICFIIPTVTAGGIETYLLRFIRYLNGEFEISVIIRGGRKGDLFEAYRKANINLLFMPLGYVNPLRSYRYFRFFKDQQFDAVCDFNGNFAGVTMLVARLAGIKKRIAFYRQGSDHFPPGLIRNSVNRLLNQLVYQNSTKILFNSNAALGVFFPYRKEFDTRFEVIYNGIDPNEHYYNGTRHEARRKLGLPEDSFIIGHVGRKDPAKNHEVVFKTVKELTRKGVDVQFVLCGSGTEELASEVNRRGLSHCFTILGYRDDVPIVLRSLNLFFFPSITEGQPNALIEAMLQGVPVIASKIPPIEECVPDSVRPYLKNPDDVDGFVSLIEKIRSDGYHQMAQRELKDWVLEMFNGNKNFKVFKDELIK